MAYVISFATARFDPALEVPNDINPIAGQALLLWLRERLLGEGCRAGEPATEDWGWYLDAEHGGSHYMVGASGQPEAGTSDVAWVVQIEKHRSLMDKLLGRNKHDAGDPLSVLIERLVRAERDFSDVATETGA